MERDPLTEHARQLSRRFFLGRSAGGLGSVALASLLGSTRAGAGKTDKADRESLGSPPGVGGLPHFAPRAKRVIYLFQSGGPAQMDLFDYKPHLRERFGQEVPPSVYPDERKTTMTAAQKSFPTAPSVFEFQRHGKSGIWMSELLPQLARVADELCVIRSMYTEAINHDPAITFLQTGSQIPGRPSIGAWLSYGLGSEAADLPAFVAMSSKGTAKQGQPLYDRLWGSGFLPARFQGVKFRNQGSPVLDLADPPGVDRRTRRLLLDHLAELNERRQATTGDAGIAERLAQYELAFRMQMSVPDLLDLSTEPAEVMELYGDDAGRPGSYAYNCLVARRLVERGVRFVQLFHQGWDQHGNLPKQIASQCRDTDRATAALLHDLKRRGLLDDTLVVWGGEFGRTIYCQGKLTRQKYGRDHHPGCFTMWLAGGGARAGHTHGETDDYSVSVARDGVHVHDLHATMLHLLGIDHERLTFFHQGRDFRLTDVAGKVVRELLA